MQVSVEELGGLERRITVQVPSEKIDQEMQSRLTTLSRKVKLDGFRPGKVPIRTVKRLYGSQVREEVLKELVSSSFQEALAQENLRPISEPKIEPGELQDGQAVAYSATFEIFPDFEPKGIEELKIERPLVEITDSDIDNMLETLRTQRATWNDVERPAQTQDRVTIDFEGKIDDNDFPGNQGKDVPIVLGEGYMLKDFEQALSGLQAGDEHTFSLTFPDGYQDLGGQAAIFSVQVKAVAESTLPEMDEDFATSFGASDISELRQATRENMERGLNATVNAFLKRQAMQGILEANNIPLPQTMVNAEIERMSEQANQQAAEGEEDSKAPFFEEEARRRVNLGLIIARLVADNNIELEEARLDAHLKNISATYEDPEKVIQWYRESPQLLEAMSSMALEEQVVDWLLERAQVIDKPSSFDEIMKPNQGETASAQGT